MNLQSLVLSYNLDALYDDIKDLSAHNDHGQLDDIIKRKMERAYYVASLLEGQGITDLSLRAEYV